MITKELHPTGFKYFTPLTIFFSTILLSVLCMRYHSVGVTTYFITSLTYVWYVIVVADDYVRINFIRWFIAFPIVVCFLILTLKTLLGY